MPPVAPLNDENKPQNDFEKTAIERILKGEKYYDEIVGEDERNYLAPPPSCPW